MRVKLSLWKISSSTFKSDGGGKNVRKTLLNLQWNTLGWKVYHHKTRPAQNSKGSFEANFASSAAYLAAITWPKQFAIELLFKNYFTTLPDNIWKICNSPTIHERMQFNWCGHTYVVFHGRRNVAETGISCYEKHSIININFSDKILIFEVYTQYWNFGQ